MAVLLVAVAGLVTGLAWGVDRLQGGEAIWPSAKPPGSGASLPTVLCSIHAVSELVRMVSGEGVNVVTLLPPGADPHTFELKPSQAAKLHHASLIVAVGGGVDPFVEGLVRAAGSASPVVRLLETVPADDLLAEDGSPSPDPHIWLDPVISRERILPALATALAGVDPAGEPGYSSRLQTASAELDTLHQWVSEQVGPLRDKALITMHPAWAYFGRRYGVETYSVLEHHGAEPTPRHVEELLTLAQERGIRVLFRERQIASSSLDILVRNAGGQVMLLDPLGGPDLPGYDSYPDLIRSNVETMVHGLTLP